MIKAIKEEHSDSELEHLTLKKVFNNGTNDLGKNRLKQLGSEVIEESI